MKKRMGIIGIVVGLVAIGLTSGAVLAQTTGDSNGDGKFSLGERVAAILGLEAEDVEGAIEQARTEMQDERVQSHLDSMVEAGILTEEEAAEYREWLDARPDGLSRGLGMRGHGGGFGGHGRGHGGMMFRFGGPGGTGGYNEAPAPEDTSLTIS